MKNKYLFYLACSLVSSSVSYSSLFAQSHNPFVQTATTLHANHANDQEGVSINELLQNAVEDSSQRTLYTALFKTPDGKVISQSSSQPINYFNKEGRLVPIKTSLHSDGQGWAADAQEYPCYLHDDRSTSINLGKGRQVTFNMNNVVGGFAGSQQLLLVNRNVAMLKVNENVDKRITFIPNGIETDYIVNRGSSFIPKGSADIVVSEEVRIPDGTIFTEDNARGNRVGDKWQGDYVLLDADKKTELARFKMPLCYDEAGHWCIGYYKYETRNGQNILQTIVPKEWLKTAVYPITIDPQVMGPVSHWTGTSIPSCYFPNFSVDSILVTIPGKITITHFDISYSYFTNVLKHIPLNDGLIYFKTVCDSTPYLSCDTNGLPGTCYIDTTAGKDDFGPNSPYFHSALTCCFNPSCSAQSFYLLQHLSRKNGLPKTCDTNWVWYSDASPFQFYAYIVGQTVQVNTWAVSPTKICSDKCQLSLNVTAQYGVPPYTVTHPWAAGKTTFGTATTCNSSVGSTSITLTIPGCPNYCGSVSNLSVPPPVVYDACGDTVTGLIAKTVTVNPVPKITVVPDSVAVCSGQAINFTVTSCISPTTINWAGSDKTSGSTGTITDIGNDTAATPIAVSYVATSSANGCLGDTVKATAVVNPLPKVVVSHDTTIDNGKSVTLNGSGGAAYAWSPSANLGCYTCPATSATPSVTTTYIVTVTNSEGCISYDSVTINVLENGIVIPNVFTPNGDGMNDQFVIKGLQYYPNTILEIFNRWGDKVYESKNYANNWDGGGQSDGVYYYILTLPTNKKYDGYVQLIK